MGLFLTTTTLCWNRLGLLGCGGFGAVELVEETKTGNVHLGPTGKGFPPGTGTYQLVDN